MGKNEPLKAAGAKAPDAPVVLHVAKAMYDASRAKVCGQDLGFPNEYDLRMARAAITAYESFKQ